MQDSVPGTGDHSSEQLDMASVLMRRKRQTRDSELNHDFDGEIQGCLGT